MMVKRIISCSVCGLLLFMATATAQQIRSYLVPDEYHRELHNDSFSVKVRTLPDGEWQDVYEYDVRVDTDTRSHISMAMFDFEGEVEVLVKKNNGTAHSAEIRPLSHDIKYKLKNNVLTFTLNKPQNLAIEFDGDKLHNLHLYTNAIEKDVPEVGTEDIIYFGEGFHTPKDGGEVFHIPSNSRVYLAPGAILKGTLSCRSSENVHISGRGIVIGHNIRNACLDISESKDITVDDIVLIRSFDSTFGMYVAMLSGSNNITINNLRIFSDCVWGDGINIRSCNDVNISDSFIRTSDDCVAIYGSVHGSRGGSSNVSVSNTVLWSDVAHTVNIGTHGDAASGKGDILENLLFRNIDILENDEDIRIYQGAIAISCGDLNVIRNVLFEDIRVENIEEGQLFHLDVVKNKDFCLAPGRLIENITFRNISCPAVPDLLPPSIEGYSTDRIVRNIYIENVRIGGRKLRSLKDLRTNEFVENIFFK